MSDAIAPALTPEEWETYNDKLVRLPYVDGQDRVTVDNCADIFTLCFYGAGPADFSDTETGCPHLQYEAWLNSAQQRHALAALALHEQPFGFTRFDVLLLRHYAATAPEAKHFANLADRIAALLPQPT